MRVLLLLAAAVAVASAENSYVVISPAKIRGNSDHAVSVNILKATRPVKVVASINRDTTTLVSVSKYFTVGFPGSITLKIPANLPSAVYTLEVVGSGGLNFANSTTLIYNSKEVSLFIQSDKAIYKPSDTVNIRSFGIFADLKPFPGEQNVSIFDAAGNQIKQWQNQIPANGVVSLSFTLSSRPVLGDWKIRAESGDISVEKVFAVAEYVLPTFSVDVVMPPYVLTADSDITATVTSKYTFGKSVQGSVDVSLGLLYSFNEGDPTGTLPISKTTVQIDGEEKVTFRMSDVKAVSTNLDGHNLVVTANVTESLTGNVMSGNGTVKMYDHPVVLEFEKTNPKTCKPGLRYIAYLKISQPDGRPVAPTTQKVKVKASAQIEIPINTSEIPINTSEDSLIGFPSEPGTQTIQLPNAEYSIPEDGVVAIPVNVPTNAVSVTIMAEFQTVTKSLTLDKSHSPSNTYIQLSVEASSPIQAGDSINFKVKSTKPVPSLVYQILAKGIIVKTGSINGLNRQQFIFSIVSNPNMAPNARIVAYFVRTDGEVVTDSISFDIGGVFRNLVSIGLNTTDCQPGDEVNVTVQAAPSSTAFLAGIDQSVLLLKSGNDVTANDVINEIKTYDSIEPVQDDWQWPVFGGGVAFRRRKRMIWWPRPRYYGGDDASQIFNNAGVKVLTDALVYQHPRPILMWPMLLVDMPPAVQISDTPTSASGSQQPVKVRSNFVETWLWQEMSIGSSGKSSITAKVPDTITSWVITGFDFHSNLGLGVVSAPTNLRVFQPFFVNLNLPYSVTRGEQIILQAIVFNYLQVDLQVQVTLSKSDSFFIIVINDKGVEELKKEDAIEDIFVAAGEAKSVFIPMVPSQLGRIDLEVKAQSSISADAIRRQLLVEAEGVPKEYNIPMLVDLTDGNNSFNQTVHLSLPNNTVKGSELVRCSAVGDMMGPTISGLDTLLQMPTGCGEQTLIYMAPDTYVTDYLESVNQLTGEIRSKAISYMEGGYQNELTYKHPDGSFSAFGSSDSSGSTWLTAYVARIFKQASKYTFIDKNIIINALNWIASHQNSNGSFAEPGNVIHKEMQSNSGEGTGLTLFVLMSFLENQDSVSSSSTLSQALTRGITYVESTILNTNNLYIQALGSYVLQLAGSPLVSTVMATLEQRKSVKDGAVYWHDEQPPSTTDQYWYSPNPTQALDTEITSYVLLTYVLQGKLAEAKRVIKWVVQQRNPNGGFQSSQDTVVALYAMSQFAKQVYSNNYNIHVVINLGPNFVCVFDIDKTNALLLQSQESATVPKQAFVSATGTGLALVEISVFFNVEVEIEDVKFNLRVKMLEESLNFLFVETCISWRGEGYASGMAVQEFGFPSGFDVDVNDITKLPILKRTEKENKKVILYFDQIGTADVCLVFKVNRIGLVAKSQPAPVRVYDYYAKRNQATVFYQSQILKNSNPCDLSKEIKICAKK